MKSILVVNKDEQVYRLILSTFKSGCTVEKTAEKTAALELLQKKRFDLVFIDLNALKGKDPDVNYRELLMPFWRLHPSVEIIVTNKI